MDTFHKICMNLLGIALIVLCFMLGIMTARTVYAPDKEIPIISWSAAGDIPAEEPNDVYAVFYESDSGIIKGKIFTLKDVEYVENAEPHLVLKHNQRLIFILPANVNTEGE